MIPELVGRIPVTVSLNDLDRDALVRILSEPKNSLIKQYKKLFEMDGVALSFDEKSLEAIAAQAIERNTGARGLRSIMENMMTYIMYEIPSRKDVAEVIIHEECVNRQAMPEYVIKELIDLEGKPNISGELPS